MSNQIVHSLLVMLVCTHEFVEEIQGYTEIKINPKLYENIIQKQINNPDSLFSKSLEIMKQHLKNCRQFNGTFQQPSWLQRQDTIVSNSQILPLLRQKLEI